MPTVQNQNQNAYSQLENIDNDSKKPKNKADKVNSNTNANATEVLNVNLNMDKDFPHLVTEKDDEKCINRNCTKILFQIANWFYSDKKTFVGMRILGSIVRIMPA